MATDRFFDESSEQSRVKAAIVAKYFWAWAKVILPSVKTYGDRLAYIDLFAGPGRYKDGTMSTPLLVLKTAIEDPELRGRLVTMFNDKDQGNARTLEEEIAALPGISTLKYPPSVYNNEVGSEIVSEFEGMRLVPTLFFVDPWGYKGLSLKLVNSVLKDWGCDCIIFFNYNRINMGLSNELVREHMEALFGDERAEGLRARLEKMSPTDRELEVVEKIAEALREMGGNYVLPFRFKNETGSRTTHHLIFVSKHVRGYTIMKEIMAGESSLQNQGVATFEYSVADVRFSVLFQLTQPLDKRASDLAGRFAGRTMTMLQVFEEHQVGTPYIKRNYKDALRDLEASDRIEVSPPIGARRKLRGEVTFADTVTVSFPMEG